MGGMTSDDTLTSREVVLAIADRTGIGLVLVDKMLGALDDVIVQAAERGQSVKLGTMTVEHVVRAARTGRNPQTGEPIEVPAHGAVKITPSAALKRAAREADIDA